MISTVRHQLLLAVLATSLFAASARPCSRMSPVSPEQMVEQAGLIVRVTALDYAQPPDNPNVITTGEPDSRVRFRVEAVLKGRRAPSELELSGYLADRDDYNELPVPYHFVRRGGRAGSCFANTYRAGAR